MKNFIILLLVCFIVLLGVAYFLNQSNTAFGFIALTLANALLATVFFISFNMNYRGLTKNNGNNAYRAKISSTMLKFFVIIGAVLLYVVSQDKGTIHKPTIYYFGGAYITYMVIETVLLSKIARTGK